MLSVDWSCSVGGKLSRSKLFWCPHVRDLFPIVWNVYVDLGLDIIIVTMFGLVVTADNVLLKHEADRRLSENALRKEARIDLARRGVVSTETAIREWKEERKRAMESTLEDSPP